MAEPQGPVYGDYEDILRRHHQENYDSGRYPFERYEVAYTYGFNLAADEPYRHRDWLHAMEDIRRQWEEEGAGPWEDFKGAIKKAWETAKEAMGS